VRERLVELDRSPPPLRSGSSRDSALDAAEALVP
jgi:hypothetical protein